MCYPSRYVYMLTMNLDIIIIEKDKEAIISVFTEDGKTFCTAEFRPEIDTDNPDMSKDYIALTEYILQMLKGDNPAEITLNGQEN